VAELRQHRGGRLGAPPGESRIAVGRVPDERQVVGYRLGRYPVFVDHPLPIQYLACPSVELDDPRVADTLGEILVGRADDDALHLRVGRGPRRRRGERIVGLELHHRPHRNSGLGERLLEQRELRHQVGGHPLPGLVAGPELVPERFDDVIGSHPEIPDALAEQAAEGGQHAPDGRNLAPTLVAGRRNRVVVTEELVRAIDEIDLQKRSLGPEYRMREGCAFQQPRSEGHLK
jgi:hypothetical protein